MTAKKTQLSIFIFIISIIFNQQIKATPSYKMELNETIKDDNNLEINVYINSIGDSTFSLTSYQCAFSVNQDIDFSKTTFSYVEGSSGLQNEPNLYVGVDDLDGVNELTFVSFIGNDKISSSKTLVGTFLLSGEGIGKVSDIGLQWNFEGTVSTIITGKGFENITNPQFHVCNYTKQTETQQPQTEVKINIVSVTASSTADTNTSASATIDGKGSNDGDQNSRWATSPMPAYLIFDLGKNKLINKTKFSFFYYDHGRIYQYNVKISDDMENWEEVLSNVSSKEEEWSEETFSEVEGRYVKLEFIGSTNNSGQWANLWEAEIYGTDATSEVAEEEPLPSDYGISQNYPNPFNPTTKVEIKMKEGGRASLDVFNILGEKVLSVLDEKEFNAGIHEVSIDARGLPSGVYIYKLNVDNNFTQIKKMNLLK